jgi:methyl-accepting chemotaxis protein
MPFFNGSQTRDYFLISVILYDIVPYPKFHEDKALFCLEMWSKKEFSPFIELLTVSERYLYCETSEVNEMSQDKQLIEMLQLEMRAGFALLADGIGQTNTSLKQTNAKLDQTIVRLDQTNAKLDQTIENLHEFRAEVNTKLSGISSLMLSSERNVGRLEKRIVKLEDRMNQFEDNPRPPSN